ncbi:MAG: phosphoribosylformylglycinamidine synthase subunit PurS [Clostridia bacterium]|jgi:phosphoribosylformylglycinamidine synthase|uniref:phosphoribosylformylglycinamidine synthase subunit PurS n=1 Tax=Desulfitibacter alkalitolerans TaxID=264641 RepID=UPI0004850E94|nr:phosphoribosylformylglycinamidine synthase subunit PurS [Desulfitibacter alkalitolerans]MBS3970656.1 phosphoribosylformylglycinamidine synthase subunit PurS [Clostridia bacterium]
MFHVKVYVALKKGVLDPQGSTIQRALESMDFQGVQDVRVGKVFEVKIAGDSKEMVEAQVEQMCKKLLANPVIEEYSFQVTEV